MYARLRGAVHVIIAVIAILTTLAYVSNIVYIYISVVYIGTCNVQLLSIIISKRIV